MRRNLLLVILLAAASGAGGHRALSASGEAHPTAAAAGSEDMSGDSKEGCVGPEARIDAYLDALGENPKPEPAKPAEHPSKAAVAGETTVTFSVVQKPGRVELVSTEKVLPAKSKSEPKAKSNPKSQLESEVDLEPKPRYRPPVRADRVDVVIATVPDPFASRLDYEFDLIVSALQQAAGADDYTFDRYGLAWDLTVASDPKLAPTSENCPRAEPSVLIFRKNPDRARTGTPDPGADRSRNDPEAKPDRQTLLVFLVGETPTAGVHPRALERAITLAVSYARPLRAGSGISPIRIVGPTFSGSAEPLGRILDGYLGVAFRIVTGAATVDRVSHFLVRPQPVREKLLAEVSGAFPNATQLLTRGTLSYHELESSPVFGPEPAGVTFSRTAHVARNLLDAASHFLANLEIEPKTVALLAEESTVVGNVASHEALKGWRVLQFPLHVSQVRRAFEDGKVDPAKAAVAKYDIPRLVMGLHPDHTHRPGEVLRNFSDATDNYDELMLVGQLTALCRSRVKAIGIVATDARDRRFLVGKVRELCPDALPFTFGGDLLFAYPENQDRLAGTVIFSSYPLFAPARTWARTDKPPQTQFGDSASAAVYNAMLFQLEGQEGQPLPQMLDYGCPFPRNRMSSQDPGTASLILDPSTAPPVWVSLASREGILPLDVRCDVEVKVGDHVVPTSMGPGSHVWRFGRLRTLFFFLLALSVYALWLTIRWRPGSSLPRTENFLRMALFLLSFAVLSAVVLEIRVCAKQWPPTESFWKVLWPIGPISASVSGACALVAAFLALKPRWHSPSSAVYLAAALIPLAAGTAVPLVDHIADWALLLGGHTLTHDYRVLLTAQRATYITSGVSPLVPLLVLAVILHCFLRVLLRRSSLGASSERGPFGRLFGKSPPPTISKADEHIRELVRMVPGGDAFLMFLKVLPALAFATFVALRSWSPTPEGAWFDDLFRIVFFFVILTIVAAWLRSVLLWLALRTVLQRIARHPLRHALRKLPRLVPRSRFAHLLSGEPRVRELEGSLMLLTMCEPDASGDDVAKAIGSGCDRSVWAVDQFESHQEKAADLAADEELQARWRSPGTTKEATRPQPGELFIARQFTLMVAWVVAHIRLQTLYLVVGSLGVLLAAGSYAFTSTRLMTLTVWIVVIVSTTTATWLVLDFNRTEVSAWMMGARQGKVLDWKLAGHLVTVSIIPLVALIAFQFPAFGQWFASSLGPLLHAFGSVAGGGE